MSLRGTMNGVIEYEQNRNMILEVELANAHARLLELEDAAREGGNSDPDTD